MGLVVYLFLQNCNFSFALWFFSGIVTQFHYTCSLKIWPHSSPQSPCQVCQWWCFWGWGKQGNISLYWELELLFSLMFEVQGFPHISMCTKTWLLQPERYHIWRNLSCPPESGKLKGSWVGA
jgi:hypothetical protein